MKRIDVGPLRVTALDRHPNRPIHARLRLPFRITVRWRFSRYEITFGVEFGR